MRLIYQINKQNSNRLRTRQPDLYINSADTAQRRVGLLTQAGCGHRITNALDWKWNIWLRLYYEIQIDYVILEMI